MSISQQLFQLVSQSPGNLVYHIVTLFALQAVFALARSQMQREPGNQAARKMAWTALAIVAARLGLMAAEIVWQNDPDTAVSLLPPLEQTVHAVTAVFIVFALAPTSRRYPRLGNTLLIIALLVIGVISIFFTQAWQNQPAGSAYANSPQAVTWHSLQIGLLGMGLLTALLRADQRSTLRPIILFVLLLAQAAQLINLGSAEINTEIAYWVRLGYLVAFPLWAVLAYRLALKPLLTGQHAIQPANLRLARSFALSTRVFDAADENQLLTQLVNLSDELLNARYVGLAVSDEADGRTLHLVSNRPQSNNGRHPWELNLDDWPAFRMALDTQEPVVLEPEGMGARQLHDWYAEIGSSSMGSLRICPVALPENLNLLLLLAGTNVAALTDEETVLAGAVARYAAQAINSWRHSQSSRPSQTDLLPGKGVSGRIIALEDERRRLMAELETTSVRLQQAETQAAEATQQARDLSATLTELEAINRGQKIVELEAEIEALRESLIEAEEAMAMASAGEGGLTTEWVMLTITRYSGQLEKAEERILQLENELDWRENGPVNEIVTSVAQELRQPMTSIAGYTDILLDERIGILGNKQRDFLQRIRANTDRLGALLDQIVQMTTVGDQPALPTNAIVHVSETLETAVSAVITQIREKNLFLDMDIAADLPPIPVSRNALNQIITSLLGNACQATSHNGRVAISAHTHTLADEKANGRNENISFLQLTITDAGGGIDPADRPHVFAPHHRADNPLIAGLGDTGVGLSVARTLVEANGGRIWVDSEIGVGSAFSTLFPVAEEPGGVAPGGIDALDEPYGS